VGTGSTLPVGTFPTTRWIQSPLPLITEPLPFGYILHPPWVQPPHHFGYNPHPPLGTVPIHPEGAHRPGVGTVPTGRVVGDRLPSGWVGAVSNGWRGRDCTNRQGGWDCTHRPFSPLTRGTYRWIQSILPGVEYSPNFPGRSVQSAHSRWVQSATPGGRVRNTRG
jgi:hypothetical protein